MSRHRGFTGEEVALITGGGTGIGAATARLLAASGVAATVLAYSESDEAANAEADSLRNHGTAAIAIHCDVRDPVQVSELVDRTVAEFGRVDFLVNSAGSTRLIPFHDPMAITEQDWTSTYDTNVVGAFRAIQAASDALRATKGAVVNIGSISGYRAVGSSVPYGVSKAAVLQLTRAMALSLAPDVRVNSVSPGTVTSRWFGRLVGHQEADRRFAAEAGSVPLGRLATADDVAEVVVGLLGFGFVTGQDIVLDGGKHLCY